MRIKGLCMQWLICGHKNKRHQIVQLSQTRATYLSVAHQKSHERHCKFGDVSEKNIFVEV